MKMLRMRFQERLANPSAGFGSFLRNMEEILDVARGRQEDYTGKMGPVPQIDAGKVKYKARRVGVRDGQGEEGSDKAKKGVTRGCKGGKGQLKQGGGCPSYHGKPHWRRRHPVK